MNREKLETTRRKKIIITILLFSLIALYGLSPTLGQAVTYALAKDTISDSDLSAPNVTHTIQASTTVAITAAGYFEIVFPAGFTNIATGSVTCPATSTAGVAGNTVTCTFTDGLVASSTYVTIAGVTNPGTAGSQIIRMYSKNSGGTELEKATMRVAIISDVDVSATVEATLIFSISGLATSSIANGITTTGSSTATTLAFGVIDSTGSSTLGQRLNVTTNASAGFTVTVEQDHDLETAGSADINTFKDGTAVTTAENWVSPAGTLGSPDTYGHFGFSSDDANLSGGDDFGAALFKGFDGTTPVEVMYHTGPADGSTNNIGSTTVAYGIEINVLQETGDYANTLTYICTPTY